MASAFADPHFVGFWQQHIDIGGKPGTVYSMLSDETVSISSQLILLYDEDIHCPPREDSTLCWQQTGTYFGLISVMTANGDRLLIEAGSVEAGFLNVTVNGQPLPVGSSFGDFNVSLSQGVVGLNGSHQHEMGASNSADHPSRASIYVTRPSHRSLTVYAGLYEVRVDNQDDYLDFVSVQVSCWPCMTDEGGVRPEGLLGRTWDRDRLFFSREPEEELELYKEANQDIFGCQFHHDRFCAHQRKRETKTALAQ